VNTLRNLPLSVLDSQVQTTQYADPPALHVLAKPFAHSRSHSEINPILGSVLPSQVGGSVRTVLMGALWSRVRSHQKSGAAVSCSSYNTQVLLVLEGIEYYQLAAALV
jgi:hypothetical protein